MIQSVDLNFAARLVQRLSAASSLTDAVTGEIAHSSQLVTLIPAFGAAFAAGGLAKGDRILIGCKLSPLSSLAYLGAMYAGFVPVPVEDNTLRTGGRRLVEATGATAFWVEKESDCNWATGGAASAFAGNLGEQNTQEMQPAACTAADLAVLIATSGSTGAPRFVMVTHGNLIANTEAIIRSQRLGNDERAMLILPLSYCFGASILHTHLYQGGRVVFDRRFMFPDKVLRAIAEYECTTFAGVPTVYNILLRRSNIRSIPMPTLRRFLQAGGHFPSEGITEMRALAPTVAFHVMYGQTEATARISSLDPHDLDTKLGSVGRALENVTIRVLDEEGKDLPGGETGEILVKGPSVTLGYLNEPEVTERVFENGWLRTGDLGYLDADGYLWISGRKGSFLKMRGVRVSFAEVESRVNAVPGVCECAATSTPHPEAGEALVLFVAADRGEDGVVEKVRRSLPTHWTCASIKLVSSLPRTANGKVALASLLAGT